MESAIDTPADADAAGGRGLPAPVPGLGGAGGHGSSRRSSWATSTEVAGWWDADDRLSGGVGVFREIVSPRVDGFETLYPFTDRLPGVAGVMDGVSDEIEEHAYWGSMRDRIPRSQTDRMRPSGELAAGGDPARGGRVVVRGHDDLALIRSGQDS
jgi:aldoxime dehydratase